MKYSSKILYNILLAAFLCVFANGCVFVVVGAAGAVGGYAVSRDTFEGVTNKSQDELVAASRKVLSIMGTILNANPKEGIFEATVQGAHVTVVITQVNMTTSKLRVKARKLLFPRSGIAQEVYNKIINQLEQ
ncbi:MAG: DUF3568 family protein [Candidatus Omnitrophica bacterium]|nr:DUF3568 family protein [Candidatus Omnitrophota bacterium]